MPKPMQGGGVAVQPDATTIPFVGWFRVLVSFGSAINPAFPTCSGHRHATTHLRLMHCPPFPVPDALTQFPLP